MREPNHQQPWVIIGAGFTGSVLARRLTPNRVPLTITRRSQKGLDHILTGLEGVRGWLVDLSQPDSMKNAEFLRSAVIVCTVPPTGGDFAAERRLTEACARQNARCLIYLSSTSVYPAAGGAHVDETFAGQPSSARGQERLGAETTVLNAALAVDMPCVALRAAGIYGPGRGIRAQLEAGTLQIIDRETTHVSRIHVDDLVSAIICVATHPQAPYRIYNVADDEPAPSAKVGDAVAAALGWPKPPRVPVDRVSSTAAAMLCADRRIDNHRLKSLGWQPQYPSWREGMLGSQSCGRR